MRKYLEYLYTYDRSLGATGFFSCVPAENADLAELLAIYGDRPLDSFLHDWLSRKILSISPDELANLMRKDISASQARGMAALAPEIRLHAPRVADALLALLSKGDLDAAEKPTLARELAGRDAEAVESARLWRANIERRAPPPRSRSRILRRANIAEIAARIPHNSEKSVDPRETAAKALDALTRAGILLGGEMRHEASLSPIALLRKWRIDARVANGRNRHILKGEAISYGRGLSLARARAACLMETAERACAYASVEDGKEGAQVAKRKSPFFLKRATSRELRADGVKYYHPDLPVDISDAPLYWAQGETVRGEGVWVPAQAVFLFCNLDETSIFSWIGSTGLGAGNTVAEARMAALSEVVERDSDAATPWSEKEAFVVQSRDPRIQELLNDYRFRGINIVFQDITGESGVPAYRCYVEGRDGEIARASAADLNGARAALSALLETPWPYSWANPLARSAPTIPARPETPIRCLEDLPNYDLGSASANLALIEESLRWAGREPIYVDISREDLDFPVVRAFVRGYCCSAEFDELNPPPSRLTGEDEN